MLVIGVAAFIHRNIKSTLFEWGIRRVILLLRTTTVAIEFFQVFFVLFYFLIFTKNTKVKWLDT